jgi:hypothetical protein
VCKVRRGSGARLWTSDATQRLLYHEVLGVYQFLGELQRDEEMIGATYLIALEICKIRYYSINYAATSTVFTCILSVFWLVLPAAFTPDFGDANPST